MEYVLLRVACPAATLNDSRERSDGGEFDVVRPAIPQRIWQKSNKGLVPVFTELDNVQNAVLGGIDLQLQRKYGRPNDNQSFHWTFIREPSERAQAEFILFEGKKGRSNYFIKRFHQFVTTQEHLSQYSLRTLGPSFIYSNSTTDFDTVVGAILQKYHFIGVVERIEESLVVFKILMGLEWGDILFLPSNDIFAINGTTNCVFLIPMLQRVFFLNSKDWKIRVKGDEELYQAAVRSLDITIDHLGRSMVETQVLHFQEVLQRAQHKCFGSTTFACSINGVRKLLNDCMQDDKGCGYVCLDTVTN
jgi:hypothetical protein